MALLQVMSSVETRLKIKVTEIGHFIGGLVVGLISNFNPTVTIIVTLLFVIYELDKHLHSKPGSWYEIRQYICGVYVGVLLWLVIVIGKVIT